MKRLTKIVPKEPIIPEFGYIVFTNECAIVWNGAIGIRYGYSKIGTAIAKLVRQYGTFAIIDALQFYRAATSLEKKAERVIIDEESSMLKIIMPSKRGAIQLPIARNLPKDLPHLAIDWDIDSEEIDTVPLDTVWLDASDLITKDGITMWGDVIGVYDAPDWVASFDYGVLLYRNKTGHDKQSAVGIEEDVYFCPVTVLDLGLKGMERAGFVDDSLYIYGPDVMYFTKPAIDTHVVSTMLAVRDAALEAKEYKVTMDLNSGLWRRAKLFAGLALELIIKGGSIILKGDNWNEVIGTTEAPNATFITRISLLERWTIGSTEHGIRIAHDDWYLTGTTRKGSEFIASLTSIGTGASFTGAGEEPDSLGDRFEGGSAEEDDDTPLLVS